MKQFDNVRDKLIDIYCGKDDDMRPQLLQPNDFENHTVFTDAHILILIPHDLITEAGKREINIGGEFRGFKLLSQPKLLTYEAFKLALLNIKCEADHYYTSKDCRCNNKGCKRCDYEGTYMVKGKKNGLLKYLLDEDGRTQYIKLGEGFFDPNYIYKVIYLIELLGLQLSIIQLTHNSANKGSVLKISEVTAVIMPMQQPYQYTSKDATAEIL